MTPCLIEWLIVLMMRSSTGWSRPIKAPSSVPHLTYLLVFEHQLLVFLSKHLALSIIWGDNVGQPSFEADALLIQPSTARAGLLFLVGWEWGLRELAVELRRTALDVRIPVIDFSMAFASWLGTPTTWGQTTCPRPGWSLSHGMHISVHGINNIFFKSWIP